MAGVEEGVGGADGDGEGESTIHILGLEGLVCDFV